MPQIAPAPDQRQADRFGLALPITMEGDECALHDLSAIGLLVESPTAPEVGARVGLVLEYEAHGRGVNLACQGEVVRVERLGDSYNIALRLSQPLFREEPSDLLA